MVILQQFDVPVLMTALSFVKKVKAAKIRFSIYTSCSPKYNVNGHLVNVPVGAVKYCRQSVGPICFNLIR